MNEYDFTQTVNSTQLLDEIGTAGLPAPSSIVTDGASVQVFYAAPLTQDQQSSLGTVVSNHVANPSYITLAVQADIATLIAYLNNPDTTTANTARAVIIQNLAPRLPDGLIRTINGQIASALGS